MTNQKQLLEYNVMNNIKYYYTRAGKSMEVEGLVVLFKRIGLDETKSQETARNKKLSKALNECVEEAGCTSTGMERSKGLLLYLLASKMPSESNNRKFVVSKVMKEDLKTDAQILAAVQ